jgi:nicotinate-nucleotide adenylyltransferase
MTDRVRVGVLGGTFDPIHFGHLAAARVAQESLGLTEVRFIPSHHPPHRSGRPFASGTERLAMIGLAVADEPGWHASDIELQRQGPSYTYDTLMALHAEGLAPSAIFFILGADAFAEIRTWSRYPDVLDAAHFVAIARHGTSLKRIPELVPEIAPRLATPVDAVASDRTCVVFIEADTPDVSSTDVRERAGRGLEVADAVPAPVAAYITSHGLYRTSGGSRSRAAASGR